MTTGSVDALREQVGSLPQRKVKNRTVIRFTSGNYTYAAVYTGGKWWITGTGRWYGRNVFDHEEFVRDVLGAAGKVQVATRWETI